MERSSDFEPYYAVIFTSIKNEEAEGYSEMANYIQLLAEQQEGYLGFESARNELGISVSYWKSLEDIKNWKQQSEHQLAQKFGKATWYRFYKVRICKVEREYEYGSKT